MLLVVSGMAFEARIAEGPSICTVYGLDSAKLQQDIERAVAQGAKAIVSFGTAAGLMPSLVPGTVIVARQIHSTLQTFATDNAWADALLKYLPEAMFADIACVDEPLARVKAKTVLYAQSQAAVADMESHHVARIALAHGLPFAAVRVVLDGAHRALPQAALAATRPDGTINYCGLVASLLAQPGQIPALIQLAGDQAKAKKALLRCGDLLKHDRFGLMHLGG